MSPVPGSDSTPPTGPRVRLTYDDFVHFPDDGMRHELIDGEHYVTPAPSWKHQTVIGNLYVHIWNYLKQHPVGRVCMSRSTSSSQTSTSSNRTCCSSAPPGCPRC